MFSRHGYKVLGRVLPEPARSFLFDYAVKSGEAGRLKTGDGQLDNTPACYSDPLMEALLDALRPRVEAETGMALLPTYSYYRIYKRGDVLQRHTDREACEASVTVNLGGDEVWPIWLEAAGGAVPIHLEPGEALAYRGTELPHWRDSFGGGRVVQVFLHYVGQQGRYREWIFDKRAQLGTSSAAELIIRRLLPR
jgi:hypothetical protein